VNTVSRLGPEVGELLVLHISGIFGSDQLHTSEWWEDGCVRAVPYCAVLHKFTVLSLVYVILSPADTPGALCLKFTQQG